MVKASTGQEDTMKWFRPFIVALLSVAVVAGFFVGKISSETFTAFATGLVVWYFKARDDEKKE